MMTDDVYAGPERRQQTIQMEAIEAVVERLMQKVIAEHEAREQAMWGRAFPDGDPEAHRGYHQAKIDAAKAEEEFWSTIRLKIAESGIIGTIRLLLYLLLLGLAAIIASKGGFLPAMLTWLGGK